jgi:hypothetical protein
MKLDDVINFQLDQSEPSKFYSNLDQYISNVTKPNEQIVRYGLRVMAESGIKEQEVQYLWRKYQKRFLQFR